METCVFCHGPLDLTTHRCKQCGQLQPARSTPLPSVSTNPIASGARCPRCGEVLLVQARFCPNCAQPLNLLSGSTFITPSASGQLTPMPPGQPPSQSQPPASWRSPSAGASAWHTPTPAPSGFVQPALSAPLAPPPPPLSPWDRLFGPPPIFGTPVPRINWVQRRLLPAQPATAGSVWFGALAGAASAFVVAFGLSMLFSLIAGPPIDHLISGSSTNVSLFSNPLLIFAGANLSEIDLKEFNGSTLGIGLPVTVLTLFPIVGLLLGGYIAASTDFTGRRLFSITRGASIGIIYALLVLIMSLVASSTITSSSEFGTSSLVIAPNAGSAFLYALLGGVGFGALGGAWRARRLPRGPAAAETRLSTRIRGALVGAGVAISVYFALCLILTVVLFIMAQQSSAANLASTFGFTGGLCSTSAPSTSSLTPYTSNLPVLLLFIIISPLEILWWMALSLGAPLQVTEGGASVSIGLFGADCPPGPQAQSLYLLLLIPAVALLLGGLVAARIARPRTGGEAAGIGLLLALALMLLMLLVAFLATFSWTASGTATISIGPSAGGTILASLIFGCTLGTLGSLLGRPRSLLPAPPLPGGGWSTPPGP